MASHLDDGALILRWLGVLVDAERDDRLPGFNYTAFLDVVGGEILRAAPNDERARTLVGELLVRPTRVSTRNLPPMGAEG